MPISDDVERLAQLGGDSFAAGLIQRAIEHLTTLTEEACTAAGQGSRDASELFEAGQAAIEQCRTALAAAVLFQETCSIVASRHM